MRSGQAVPPHPRRAASTRHPRRRRHHRDRAPDPVKLLAMDRSYVRANGRELQRLRALVSRLSDRELGAMVNEYWSVAGVLGHIAFWDGRALFLAGKLQRGDPFTASDEDPEDV